MSRTLIVLTLMLAACASVPKQSVELSATVGRDLATVHQAHHQLAELLFGRMHKDVDRFVDEVYAPAQLASAMQHQRDLAASQSPADRDKSLLLAVNDAFGPAGTDPQRAAALDGLKRMVAGLRRDVESMRAELQAPLNAQEAEVIGAIDRAYYQIHYANSIVTGHLSSVVKVQDAQDEALKAIGVDRDLRTEIGNKLAKTSDQIAELVDAAGTVDQSIEQAKDDAAKLRSILSGAPAQPINPNGEP